MPTKDASYLRFYSFHCVAGLDHQEVAYVCDVKTITMQGINAFEHQLPDGDVFDQMNGRKITNDDHGVAQGMAFGGTLASTDSGAGRCPSEGGHR